MDLIDQLRAISGRIDKLRDRLQTEEATKNALVMPFLQALGYDVFDPFEVVPEYTADVGTKRGEKVDYAILRDDKPILLIECKKFGSTLTIDHASQLYRYYSVTEARVGVLTNGVLYQFYADLDETNKMDAKPFLEFDMGAEIKPNAVSALKQFTKQNFDPNRVIDAASELRYTRDIRRIFEAQLKEPSDDFVRFFGSQMYPGRMTQNAIAYVRELVKRTLSQAITDRINDRLKSALSNEGPAPEVEEAAPEPPSDPAIKRDEGIVTTDEEVEGFDIVRAIAREVVDPSRVVMRDQKTYCGVLFDDNNRKPIVRMYFNSANKRLGIFDPQKNEEKVSIEALGDIYQHGAKIRGVIRGYLEADAPPPAAAEGEAAPAGG